MFEAQVAGLLERYLGKYVSGLDASSLRISVWKGDVELRNLHLRPEALDELNLPVMVKSGLVGRLTLKVPWSNLGNEPVVAEFDRLYVVACPKPDDSKKIAGTSSDADAEADAAKKAEDAELVAKRERVHEAEEAWLKDMIAKESLTADPAAGQAADGTKGWGSGRIGALVNTIIGNLQLKITNLHIRYEDPSSNPGHSFCIGVMLQEISAVTTDEQWQSTFVTTDAMLVLRKLARLKKLCIYFDCDVPLFGDHLTHQRITHDIADASDRAVKDRTIQERWDKLMLPANHAGSRMPQPEPAAAGLQQLLAPSPRQQLQQHQFLLCPVDGELRYVRRGKAARELETEAEQEMQLILQDIGVRLHQLQYQSGQKLLQEFDSYAAGAPHRHLRPHCRPTAGHGARMWWRYAIAVVRRQNQTFATRGWNQLSMVARDHKQYVPEYLRYLQLKQQQGQIPKSQQGRDEDSKKMNQELADMDRQLAAMDAQLDEPVILLFRRMAHAKFNTAKKKAAAAAAAKQQAQQGWIGWLTGTGKVQHQQTAAAGATGDAMDISMGPEEWNRLEQLVADQEAALGDDKQHDTPNTVKSIIRVEVKKMASELQDTSGKLLMQAALEVVDSRVIMYPQTKDINFSVSKFGITSSHGPLMSSGCVVSTKDVPAASRAMLLGVVLQPQDSSTDLAVDLAVAPSYVTYDNTALQEVANFFKSEESVELSRLQAQAAARTDKLRHMAQLQLRALSQRSMDSKPRMGLQMTLHAPKVAVQDAAGSTTLIADLGCFIIKSNPQATHTMSAEEAAVYEPFVVKIDHVSAYFLDGPFAWPSSMELATATATTADLYPAAGSLEQLQQAHTISVLQSLMARNARVVSLLDRFGVGMDLQVATSFHPRYPVIRLAVSASPLKLHLSPCRYQQLMLVVQSVAPSSSPEEPSAAAAGASSSTPDQPLWLSEAEHTSKVSLLTWEGMSGSVAKWQSHRYVHVWRGRLYITPHRQDPEVCLTRTFWMGYNVVMLPKKFIGGIDNVVAVLPKHVKVEAAAESPEAVVLRAQDAAAAVELRKRLMASANQMAAIAGLLELGDADEQDAAIGTTKDVLDELFSHQLLLQLHGSISEVSLLIGGRAPVCWWPPCSGVYALPSTSSVNSITSTVAGQVPSSSRVTDDEVAAPVYHAVPAGAALEVLDLDSAATAAAGASVAAASGQQQLGQEPSTGGAVGAAAAAPETMASVGPESRSNYGRGMLTSLEEEVDLVAIKFQGAQVGVTVGGGGFRTEVAMAALTMDDLLVGARNPDKAHMAQSTVIWNQAQKEQHQQEQQQHQAAQQQAADVAVPDVAAALPGLHSLQQQAAEDLSPTPVPSTPKLRVNTTAAARQHEDTSTAAMEAHLAPADVQSTPDEDDEFFDAEEGDPSTPQSVRKRRTSDSSSGRLPQPAFHNFSVDSADNGAGAAAEAAADRAAGTGPLLGSHPMDSFKRAMAALEVDDATFIAAPTFAAAVHNFNAAREGEELVRLLFARYNSTSSNYTGLDVEVALNLSTLVFYCNRPTVAALMVFGTDLAAINTLLMSDSATQQDGADAAPATAGDTTTTTDSESVSDIQLVRGGGEQRTLFKLTLQVSKVELHLNYEGDVATPLAIGSIDNFLLELDVHPSTLQLHTSLGNLVADYCVLAPNHPNRTMVSMRDAQAGSLIDVVFRMHSLEDSFIENRVPSGMQYMSVVTNLSTVQIVFMNRFLIEFLDYLAAMLAMQAKPKVLLQSQPAAGTPLTDTSETNEQGATQQAVQQQATETAAQAAPAAAEPLIVLLDVHLDAPVLLMPLTSSSEDHIEVDLGTLQLANHVVWETSSEQDRQKLLLDELQITLQKVSGCVVEGGIRGRNVIREMGGGVQVSVRRAILADPLPLPPISTAVNVPKLRASILDSEYALILAVLAGNFGEAVDLPRSIAWLHQQLLADRVAFAAPSPTAAHAAEPAAAATAASTPAVAAAATAAGTAAVAAAASNLSTRVSDSTGRRNSIEGSTMRAATAAAAREDSDAQLKCKIVSDFTCTSASLLGLLCDVTTIKTTVSIGQAQLMLYNKQPQGLPPAPVGSVEFSNLWVGVLLTQLGNMLVSLSLPSVCARDLRPGVPKEASLVLSTAEIGSSANAGSSLAGTGAVPLPVACPKDQPCNQTDTASLLPSLLTLEYRMVKSIGEQPASALQVRLQRPTLVLDVGFIMKVLHFVAPAAGLQGPVPRAYDTREIHLGPTPYLAIDHLWLSPEYRIIADAPGLHEAVYDGQGHALVLPECVPAIEHVPLIVVGRGKTLRLKNVRVMNKEALAGVLLLGPGARLIAEAGDGVSWPGPEELMRLRNKAGRRIFSGKSDQGGHATQQQQQDAGSSPVEGSMNISLQAVGAAVYLIDAHAAAESPTMQDHPCSTAAGQQRPGSAGGGRPIDESGKPGDGGSRGEQRTADNATGGGGGSHAEMLRMLAMHLDLGLDMHMEGADSQIMTKLSGLSVKAQTRLLEDAAAAGDAGTGTTGTIDSLDQVTAKFTPAVQQQVATSILEPCNVKFTMRTTHAMQDLNMDVSAVQLRMSPDVMQLLLHLQQVVLEPLAVPPAGQPLTRVDRFGCMWCSHAAGEGTGAGTYATAGAGGVDILGSDKGVTVWRPQPPVGYAILGDVLSSGHSQPDHQVIAVAINSGLVTYPAGYSLVWETAGISFWRPVPPPGYVAMGCIASVTAANIRSNCSVGGAASSAQPSAAASEPVPPSRKACVVVAKQVAVEALLSECMMLCTNGNLWCIQNSCGTFEVAPPDSHQPQVPLYDLRSPLGIAPAALTVIQQPLPLSASAAQAAAAASQHPGNDSLSVPLGISPFGQLPPPHSLSVARAFAAQRASLRAKVARSGQVTTTVEFSRIWWDKSAKHPSMTKVGFWRPLPPPGYVILGDCMVPGMYCPPRSVVVVRDTDPSEIEEGKPPLLARPIKCLQVWFDGHKRARGDANYLTLWKPIAPAGYVSMGVLASTGGREPLSYNQVRCVRADMASRADLQASSPAMIFYPYKSRPALGGWVADERSSTFVVVSHDGSPQLLEGFKLKELEETPKQAPTDDVEQGLATGAAPRAMQLSLSVGKTNLLLRNLLRTPILELEAANINLGLSQEPCGVRRCWAYLTSSLWSYNQNLELWEPVMEPWQLLLHMDTNPNTYSSAGIAPGTWVRITSPQGCLHVTLAQAALNYSLDALSDWQGIAGGDAVAAAEAKSKRPGLAAADGLSVYTTILNTLDTTAHLQLDYGDGRKEVVVLQPHVTTPITQPMPMPPVSHAPLTASQPPPMRLVIDILEGQLLEGFHNADGASELIVKIKLLNNPKASDSIQAVFQQLIASTQGMVTRAVTVQSSTSPQTQSASSAQQNSAPALPGQGVQWNQRFVLALPPELAEQLLVPAPGDNPWETAPVQMQLEVWDGNGEQGLGRVVSTARLSVTYSWLLSQVKALLIIRQAAAAATSSNAASTSEACRHRRSFSNAGVAAAAEQLGKTYTINLEAADGGSGSTATAAAQVVGSSSGGGSVTPENGSAVMQLTVGVSLDDSQISDVWYPHQRMRGQLAHLMNLSSKDGSRKLAAGSSGKPEQLASTSAASAAGSTRHALRLEGSDMWSPFSYTSLRRLTGSIAGPHTGIVPIRAGQGLVLELLYTGGQYHARIRSLCQFFNSTDMTLEVALLEEDDSSWTMLPASASSSSGSAAAVGDVVEEEVFEYERYLPLRGWSADHLKGLDPHRYCRLRNGSKGSSTFPKVPLPQDWEWEGPWEVDTHCYVDSDGWAYAFEPGAFRWPPPPGAGNKKAHDFVRRRRLVRKRRRVALPSSVLDVTAAGQSTASSTGPSPNAPGEQWQRRVLGRVEPGNSLPLPQDWRSDNKQLQLRPVLLHRHDQASNDAASTLATPSHAWSYGVSNGQQSVQLSSMEDGASRLLCCKTLAESDQDAMATSAASTTLSPRKAAAAAPSCWFSTSCDANELVLQGGVDVLTDWSITAQPPLTLRNDLPVAAQYVLWERAARGGPLVLRQQGHIEGGANVNVYSVDMRQQVCLTFTPEGAEWAQSEPVLVSEGFLSNTAGVDVGTSQLPDSFCVSYANSQGSNARLRIALQRQLDTELLDSQRIRAVAARAQAAGSSSGAAAAAAMAEASSDTWQMSHGAALAQGRPLILALSVPVWVINGTQLPISIGIVQHATAVCNDNSNNLAGTGDVPDSAFGSGPGLRVVDTEAYTQVTRPNSYVTIMGNSVELLSYPGEGPDGSVLSHRGSSSGGSQTGALRALEQQAGFSSGVVQQWAAVFSVMGSRWSAPLVLTTASAAPSAATAALQAGDTAPVAEAVARLPQFEPVLVRAKCKDGCVYDITVRIETAGSGLLMSTVVRLDPHIVVSNRTGYTLHMVQPEPIWKALGANVASITDSHGTASSRSSSTPGAWFLGDSAGSAHSARRPPTAASSTPVKDATLVLRAGSLAVPLSWPLGCVRRLLLLTLPPHASVHGAAAAVAAASETLEAVDPVMWSEPFRIEYPATGVMQVLLPLQRLGTPGAPQAVTEASMAAAYAAFNSLLKQQPQQQQPLQSTQGTTASAAMVPPTGRPPSTTALRISSSSSTSSRSDSDGITAVAAQADNKPLLVHVVRHIDGGLQEYIAVAVNLAVEMPAPGCMHVILQSLGGEAQQCLMNCTSSAISYRQALPKASWQMLPPFSAAPLVLLQPPGSVWLGNGSGADPNALPSCAEVELRDADAATSGSAVCSLDTNSSGIALAHGGKRSSSGTGGSQHGVEAPVTFKIASGKAQALAQVLPFMESIMAPAGPAEVPGAGSVSVGRTQTDRLLRVLPKPASVSMNQLRLATCIAGQDQARLSPASAVHLVVDISSMDVSLIDGRPQELLLFTLDGLAIEYHAGNSSGIVYTQLLMRLNLAQLDDMMHTTPFPVVLVPADKSVLEDTTADPLLFFTHVSQPSRFRGALYTPTIAGRIAALRLQLNETLIWRLHDFATSLSASSGTAAASSQSSSRTVTAAAAGAISGPSLSAGSGIGAGLGGRATSGSRARLAGGASSGNLAGATAAVQPVGAVGNGSPASGQVSSAGQQVASADLPLQVDLLSLDDLPLRVSFRTDKASRPRWANQMVMFNTLGDMLNFEDLQLTLPGMQREGFREPRSALVGYGVKLLQREALAIMVNIFRSYGVLGTASRLLVVGSNITDKIATTFGGGPSAVASAGSVSEQRVTNVAEGFLQGGKTFGMGLLKGVTGVVTDPLAGAKSGGVSGFFSGVVRGAVGVPGQIVGGALVAASKVTEGLDASMRDAKEKITGTTVQRCQRRRLPRCIRGDRVLTPFNQSSAMGLALLYSTDTSSADTMLKASFTGFVISSKKLSKEDVYETHVTLPAGCLAIITNMRLLMVAAEAFAALEADVLAGRVLQVSSVPAGRLLWQLSWDQILSVELAYHRQQPGAGPDGIIVHRKYRSDDNEVLVHDVRCNPNNNQATYLYEAISAARQKYYLEPRREARGWKVTPVLAAEQQSDQEMPDVMLSMDFKRVWQSSKGARPLSVWRPVGPPGYASLGDVAMPGREPPHRPVTMYKDVAAQAGVLQDPVRGPLPAVVMPERFQLVFRDSGGGNSAAVSIWRPIAPKGYMEVGYVVVSAIEEPPQSAVRLMRADLLKQARLYDYPVWSDASGDNVYWQCGIWQVDNPCCTFVAVKGKDKPNPRQAVSPKY